VLEGTELRRRGAVILGAMRTARAASFRHDDALLVTATRDDVVAFDLRSGSAIWTSVSSGDEPALAFAPDGHAVAVGIAPESLAVLDGATGASLRTLALPAEPRGLLWDRHGLVALTEHALMLFDNQFTVRGTFDVCRGDDESRELAAMGNDRIAIAGSSSGRVWVEIRLRATGALERSLVLDGDHRAEGLAFAGGVLFVATEGGTYRIDPPFEQLVRWLPPLGGAHDPTRLAPLAGGHIAIAARDVRVFRTRS
jgi:hypothetical protein